MKNKELNKHLYAFLGKKKVPYITISILCILYESLFVLTYSIMYKMFFNSIEYNQFAVFKQACIFCVIIFVVDYFSVYLSYYRMRQVRVIVFNVKIKMFDKLTGMDMQFFDDNHSGDTLKRLNWDANSLKVFYYSAMHRVIEPIVTGVVSIVTMTYYNWRLSICSVVFTIITVRVSLYINRIVKKQNKEIQRKLSKLSERLSDILSGFLILKLFSGSKLVLDQYDQENDQVTKETIRRARVLSNMDMLSFLIGMIGSFGTIAVGIVLVTKGMIDYGTIMAIVTLQLSLCGTMQRFGGSVANLTANLACAQRVDEFLELPAKEKQHDDSKNEISVDQAQGIDVEDVSFTYPSANQEQVQAISHVSLNVMPGERIMLVGSSGCGKSTILKLLMGFYAIDSGNIRILGNPINSYTRAQLRKLITYVPQDSFLFDGTIEDNIKFGNPNATHEQVVNAAKMAYADGFIKQLPKQYDTMVVSGGRNVSGGQRQRIAIARAFLKDAPIILLDEPSSALDVESEGMINQSMKELMKNKMVIMVTHRTNSFKEFDRVVQMKN
jgi:ATP-binding cassette subfamily B protein